MALMWGMIALQWIVIAVLLVGWGLEAGARQRQEDVYGVSRDDPGSGQGAG